jgi:hypothetical protein
VRQEKSERPAVVRVDTLRKLQNLLGPAIEQIGEVKAKVPYEVSSGPTPFERLKNMPKSLSDYFNTMAEMLGQSAKQKQLLQQMQKNLKR